MRINLIKVLRGARGRWILGCCVALFVTLAGAQDRGIAPRSTATPVGKAPAQAATATSAVARKSVSADSAAVAAQQQRPVPDSARLRADTTAFGTLATDTTRARTPVPAPAKKTPPPKIKLVKHAFNFREQIIMAVCMMFFVLLMMNTAQAMNPE